MQRKDFEQRQGGVPKAAFCIIECMTCKPTLSPLAVLGVHQKVPNLSLRVDSQFSGSFSVLVDVR